MGCLYYSKDGNELKLTLLVTTTHNIDTISRAILTIKLTNKKKKLHQNNLKKSKSKSK